MRCLRVALFLTVRPSLSEDRNTVLCIADAIVTNNPDLRELEIISVGLTSAIHQNMFIKPKNRTETWSVKQICRCTILRVLCTKAGIIGMLSTLASSV